MNSVILADAQTAPDLFLWNGPIERSRIEEWVARHAYEIPDDLVQFWTITGGGDLFETERVLPPLTAANDEDEIATLTAWCRERGMPSGHIVFHEGFRYTAIRCNDRAYVSFDGEVQVCGEYKSLDHWYTQVLRAEYAAKYRLPGVAGV